MKRLITIICLMAIYANADVRIVNPVDTSGIEADVAANTTLITTTSNGLSSAYIAADTVVSNALQAAIDASSDSALDNRTATNNVSMGGFDITGGGDSTFTNFITAGGNTLNNPYGFKATRGATQSITNEIYTKITWETELFDNGSGFDLANNKFVPPLNGRYYFNAHIHLGTTFAAGKTMYLMIYTNGVVAAQQAYLANLVSQGSVGVTATANLTTNDYVEAYVWQNDATETIADAEYTWFEGFWIGE